MPEPKRHLRKTKTLVKDPIEVFCRLRPLENINDQCCIKPLSDTTVCLSPPDAAVFKNGAIKESHYSFKYVFDDGATQKAVFDKVALPLIRDLFDGANGLLFTYGITSSGKTYTMTGTPQNCGLLPRCLDVVFNSIRNNHAAKYVFKPDKMNGFEVQTNAEAMLDQQKELGIFSKVSRGRKKEAQYAWNQRVTDVTVVDNINEDQSFAVFVSYVEIYNNYIYDLLEDIPDSAKDKPLQSKMLRQDASNNMYVFQVTEIEVRNADDAMEYYHKGQIRRRVSNTALNTQSSRSHSVFSIRLVQAPLDAQGAEVLQGKSQVSVSQLSLVDLAGSERSVRTGNKGERLREAGNINASLMALRTCIEILKETQTQGAAKIIVPYRESKLTHLFKSFFEGEGKIRMIVCVNPRAEDYEETLHVMKFAELTQEVLIARPTPITTPVTIGFRHGRGNIYREAVRKAREDGIPLVEALPPTVYSLGPDFSPLYLEFDDDDGVLESLCSFLTERKNRRVSLASDLSTRQSGFRNNLIAMDKENLSLKQEVMRLKMDLQAREQQLIGFERKLSSCEEANDVLRKRIIEYEGTIRLLESQISNNELLLNNEEKEKEHMKTRMQNQLRAEKERMNRIMESRLAQKEAELSKRLRFNEERFRMLQEILNFSDCDIDDRDVEWIMHGGKDVLSAQKAAPAENKLVRSKTAMIDLKNKRGRPATVSASKSDPDLSENTKSKLKSVAVANPRHRRSMSSNSNVWLEHKPVGSLEMGTVLQPKMKKKKSVGKLEVKDILTKDVSKYVLTHQEQDSAGEVETQLYKGDVIPSAGGGAQVIFNDVEKLRQVSPTCQYKLRKRSAEELNLGVVEDRCTVAVECHGKPSKVMRKAK